MTMVPHIRQKPMLESVAYAANIYCEQSLLFRYDPANGLSEEGLRSLNIDICHQLRSQGKGYVDYARYKGKTGIRLILANDGATEQDIDRLLENITHAGRELSAR